MKKKLALLALVFVVLVTPAFSAGVSKDNSVGVGLNLGTNTGVGLRFGLGDFDILSNLGFSMLDAFEGDFRLNSAMIP